MNLAAILSDKRAIILSRWFDLILETFPGGSSLFLKQEEDSLLNPIGQTISRETQKLYDGLLNGCSTAKLAPCLEAINRIVAIQDCTQFQSIVFLLKQALNESLLNEIEETGLSKQMLELVSRIDELALIEMQTYLKCREKIFDIRIKEMKSEKERILSLMAKINALPDMPESDNRKEKPV